VAIIGGTGLEKLLKTTKIICSKTPFGTTSAIYVGEIDKKEIAFLPRHGPRHSIPPHKVNYKANIYALHEIGVKQIIATNAVGAINRDLKPGDLTIPFDLVDFTKCRESTFNDKSPVTHVDVSEPYCPVVRSLLIDIARKNAIRIGDRSVLACTEGPRYETPAEIEMFRKVGCDIVGMTGTPEAFLARELEICYATICFISNMAAGIQKRLTTDEVAEMAREKTPFIESLIKETIFYLPKDRNCPCVNALKNSRF
jgi:5'-methylthioadenosine phosphorylase